MKNLIVILFLTIQFSSCNFYDKDGNKVKIDFKEDNLFKDERLKNMLDDYTTALPSEKTPNKNVIESFIKAEKIATKITTYINNYATKSKKASANCLKGLEKLKEVNAKLNVVIQKLITIEKKNIEEEVKYESIRSIGGLIFGKHLMLITSIKLDCTISVEKISN